jgi:prophage antirepressor-like protein
MNKIITKDFNGSALRIFTYGNKEWFIAKDVAKMLGYKDLDQTIRQHCKRAVSVVDLISPVNLTGLDFSKITTPNNYKSIKLIPESDVWRLIIKSRLPEAEKIEKWIMEEVLPSIRKTGSYSISENSNETKTDRELKGLKMAIEILRVNEGSKILMMKKLYQKIGLETEYLPNYSEENHTFSLTHLLKEFEVNLSAKRANEILLAKGILEIQTRKSSKSFELKEFKSLTENGLKFGKNLISPNNQLETQPHYFRETFTELLEILK